MASVVVPYTVAYTSSPRDRYGITRRQATPEVGLLVEYMDRQYVIIQVEASGAVFTARRVEELDPTTHTAHVRPREPDDPFDPPSITVVRNSYANRSDDYEYDDETPTWGTAHLPDPLYTARLNHLFTWPRLTLVSRIRTHHPTIHPPSRWSKAELAHAICFGEGLVRA